MLELAEKEGVENKFTILVRTLNKKAEYNEFQTAKTQNDQLVKILDSIVQMLMNDDDLARLREEKIRLEAFLKELKGIIGDQKIARSITETNKADKDQLSKEQKDLANRTDNLAKAMSGQKGDPNKGQSGEKPDDKATNKPEGENKSEGKGDQKPDTGDAKASEKPPAKMGDPMQGEPSKGKGGEPKEGESGSKGKGGPPMEGAEGAPKPKGGPPEAKQDPKEPAKNDPATSKNKGDQKADQKPTKGEKSGSEGEAKPSESGKPSEGQASSKPSGQPSQGQPSQGGQPPPPQQTPGQEQVKKAVPDQDYAAEEIQKKKNEEAAKKQDDALTKLQTAQAELEKKLKQLREEELERLLAALEARVSRMLAMQKDVLANTTALDAIAQKTEDKKLPKGEAQRSQQQSDREGEIIAEASKTLDILRNEGSAVAFPGVLEEVRKDMIRVKERLYLGVVNDDTQDLEKDIITALTEMLEALKKAQQDLKDSKGQPGPSGPSKPQDKSLLDLIQELKMIRQLQVNVNNRTDRYSKKYPGEQADDPIIKGDLKDLSGKQEKIEQMVKDIAEGKNK